MKANLLKFLLLLTALTAVAGVRAQNADTAYTEKVRTNASTFHKNFSSGEFEKNGPLVNVKIYVNSNTSIVIGRENFVTRIKRFHIPFPRLALRDRIILVDGNQVGLLYIMQATQDGPYGPIKATGRKINVYAAEFFIMDDEALMKELLTITQLDQLVRQIKGDETVAGYEPVTLLPIAASTPERKKILKANIESYVQDFNTRDWAAFDGLLADNVQVNWNGKISTGKQAVKDGLNNYTTLLPDLTFHVERNIVEGDRGALAYTMIGTHTDTSKMLPNGQAATKRIEAKEGVHLQFDPAGKIIAITTVSNSDELKSQL